MTHKQRVMAAVSHQQPDRVPRGELAIENDLLCSLIGPESYDNMNQNERQLKAWRMLDADLINIHQFPMQQVSKTDQGLDARN